MEANEEIEMLLWEYIDGTCPQEDMHRITVLINRDEAWKQKYEELYALHTGIAGNLHEEQPSMRFTKNVMDAVTATRIAPATKKYINKNIIRGIAAFFVLTIASFIGYALATTTWSTSSPGYFSRIDALKVNMSAVFNSSTANVFIAINVGLGLLLLDTLLRRKRRNHIADGHQTL